MGSKQDLTGKRFGRLTAIKPVGITKNGSITWKCRCDCGNQVIARSGDLNYGKPKSCGKCKPPVIEKIKQFKDTVTFEDIKQIKTRNSTTGYADIYSIKQPDSVIFKANIHVSGKRVYLGRRKTLFEAIKLQEEALKLLIKWSEENGKKELKKLLGLARIALTAWITFGLGLLASGNFSKMLTIAYPIISVCFLLIYDSIFDCYLKGKNK